MHESAESAESALRRVDAFWRIADLEADPIC